MSNITSPMQGCKLQKVAINMQHKPGCKSKKIWHEATHSGANGQSGDVAILIQEDAFGASKPLPLFAGMVYSTVALPLAPTSLPVHMNGDFRLSSDRRTLWAGEGDRGQVCCDLLHRQCIVHDTVYNQCLQCQVLSAETITAEGHHPCAQGAAHFAVSVVTRRITCMRLEMT